MLLPNHIIAKEQNFSVICKGNDKIYHSDTHEYDYIKNALDVAKRILLRQIKQKGLTQRHAACFSLNRGVYLVMYIEKDRPQNPYFATYRVESKTYSQVESIETFAIFKNRKYIQALEDRIPNTIFKNTMLLPGLLDEMSKIADEYDKELDYQ